MIEEKILINHMKKNGIKTILLPLNTDIKNTSAQTETQTKNDGYAVEVINNQNGERLTGKPDH